jgi:hypothetical protein
MCAAQRVPRAIFFLSDHQLRGIFHKRKKNKKMIAVCIDWRVV